MSDHRYALRRIWIGEAVVRMLAVPGGDASAAFNALEEALGEVSLAIEPG